MDYSLLPPLPEGAKHISIIKEYEHLFGYAALPNGTILTCKPAKPTKGIIYLDYWREKKLQVHKQGYVYLKTKTKSKTASGIKVHRIIGNLFKQNTNAFPIINHLDGNKTNNNIDNLEWTTHKGNSIHAIENNLRDTACGERIPNSILKESDIIDIFNYREQGLTHKQIALKYCIDQSGVSRILSRKCWKHVILTPNLSS